MALRIIFPQIGNMVANIPQVGIGREGGTVAPIVLLKLTKPLLLLWLLYSEIKASAVAVDGVILKTKRFSFFP
jgi:hypothetical protein